MKQKYLKDYVESNYWLTTTELEFEILEESQQVLVKNITKYVKNTNAITNTLILDGNAQLLSIDLNDKKLIDYELLNNQLIIPNLPDEFTLSIKTMVLPWQNKSGMGLYASRDNLITQCEAEGFRTITYFQDRPDVMSIYTVKILTKNNTFNTVLSNGNLISKTVTNNICTTIWHDPFKKPCYLFALVIGNFAVLQDEFLTISKRKILLEIYAKQQHLANLTHAMNSIKKAMKWDEERFNLEYDLPFRAK